MKEWTGIEVGLAREELELASATVLGRMIFSFSRLDMVLGLMLVWAHEGSQLEKLTKVVSDCSFHKKLDLLAELTRTKYTGNQEATAAYAKWLEDAHAARTNRNELVHGRWSIDHMNNQVVNVVGLPTSSSQVERRYTIPELESALERMEHLQNRLSTLRGRWAV